MIEIVTTLYTFDELNERAQHAAWENTCFDLTYNNYEEFCETLREFEKIFDIKVYDYNVDGLRRPYFKYVTAGAASDAEMIDDPLRLARFVWNNYSEYILKGKYYSTRGAWIDGKYHYKSRHSKIALEMDNCPLTGVCCDCDILGPVIDCLHYKRFFNTYTDLIDKCLTDFFNAWAAEMEYCCSFDFFAETAECNEWYFTADGKFYGGA